MDTCSLHDAFPISGGDIPCVIPKIALACVVEAGDVAQTATAAAAKVTIRPRLAIFMHIKIASLGLIVTFAAAAVAVWATSPASTTQAKAIFGITHGMSPPEIGKASCREQVSIS